MECLRWFILLFNTIGLATSINWLAMHKTLDMELWISKSHCEKARQRYGLSSSQSNVCKNNLHMMPHVASAAYQSLSTCQILFRNSRWNCSSAVNAPNHTPDLTTGTREQAVVHALGSGSVVWQVAKACSRGDLLQCSCGQLPKHPPEGEFKWGGCGDNVKFALRFGRNFIYTKKKRKEKKNETPTKAPTKKSVRHRTPHTNRILPLEHLLPPPPTTKLRPRKKKNRRKEKKYMKKKKKVDPALTKVNKHNFRVGMRAVQVGEHTKCKCHGVSGSCSIKTCWKNLPTFQQIGDRLHRRYTSGVEVKSVHIGSKLRLLPSSHVVTRYTKDDLIYITKSPDYCLRDKRHGSLGTHGRNCNATLKGEGGCESMCCGRGAVSKLVLVSERCQCRYHWCCYVTCATCSSWKTFHNCN